MDDTTPQTVLGRIAATGRQERKAKAMTLQKALRVSMAKVADALMDLPVAVIGAVVQPLDGDGIEAALDDSALLMLLDGPARCVGAAMVDPVVVGAFIQQQTIGSVQSDTGTSRPMTRTDAAICAPLVDMLFARVAPILDDAEERALIEGFAFGAKAEDARTLAMALDASDYVAIKLTLDIARGVRQGELTLILPTPAAREQPRDDSDDAAGAYQHPSGPDFTRMVMGLNADLDMVVCRLQVPLSTLRALKVGRTLALTPGAFPNVQITTRTGRVLGRGVVGHVDGVRAVKPLRPPSHAAHPLRRASDESQVEMPEVEVLTSTGRRSTLPRETDVSDAELEEAMRGLDPVSSKPHDKRAKAETARKPVSKSGDDAAKAVNLPDLDDLPDLESLPDLTALPDLDDLPDLADLPDLQMRSAG